MKTVEMLVRQFESLSFAEKTQFLSLVLDARSGDEGEELVRKIPGIVRSVKGNGSDFVSYKGIKLEVKFARPSKMNGVDQWYWAHLETFKRDFDRLILIGKSREGEYSFYDLPKKVIGEFSCSRSTGEIIHIACRMCYWTSKRAHFNKYKLTYEELVERYRSKLARKA
jgi:hypothetical protein